MIEPSKVKAEALAEMLGLKESEFVEKYLIPSDEGFVIEAPCSFLKENGECEIESCRPINC